MFKIFGKVARAFGSGKSHFTSAIILCAGASTRFGANKQTTMVLSKPAVARTIDAFEKCEKINEIILVVPKDNLLSFQDIVAENDYAKISGIVTGGETRQLSAMRGLKHVSAKAKYIAVHDGARCLVTPEIIENVLADAIDFGCATAATRVTDTVKLSDEDGFIKKTVDRSNLWNVQTPQIFEAESYKSASYVAWEKGIEVTDDCMLAEYAGLSVKLTETGKDNIKITYPEDVALAEHILLKRNGEQ